MPSPQKKFTPPTLEEITDHIKNKSYSVSPTQFFYHYESNGWMIGKAKMNLGPSALGTMGFKRKRKEAIISS